jgi:hypothetical protein
VSRRLTVLALALVPVLLGSSDPAAAGWAVNGAGPATSLAVQVPRGAVPTVAKVTDPVLYGSWVPVFVLSWDSATLPGGHAVSGYQIRRTVFPGTSIARTEVVTGGTCLGTTVHGLANVVVPAGPTAGRQSCTDTEAFAKGGVTYTVTPVLSHWVGPASAASAVY